jgi:hypothetical protein
VGEQAWVRGCVCVECYGSGRGGRGWRSSPSRVDEGSPLPTGRQSCCYPHTHTLPPCTRVSCALQEEPKPRKRSSPHEAPKKKQRAPSVSHAGSNPRIVCSIGGGGACVLGGGLDL